MVECQLKAATVASMAFIHSRICLFWTICFEERMAAALLRRTLRANIDADMFGEVVGAGLGITWLVMQSNVRWKVKIKERPLGCSGASSNKRQPDHDRLERQQWMV